MVASYPTMGDVFDGRYELVDALSAGLWRAWDGQDRVYLACQRVEDAPSSLGALLARIPSTSAHLAVPVTCSGAGGGTALVLSPLVGGQLLSDRLASREPIDVDNALEITDQLLAALAVLHGAGLVHRNIADHVVMLRAGRRPHVILGGLGGVAEAADGRSTRALGPAVGTPGYMSFEAFSGAAPEPAQDLYSVGALLVQMLTGRRPSAGAVARGGVEVPAHYRDTPVGDFLAHLLATASARIGSASAARAELAAVRAALTAQLPQEGPQARFAAPFIVEDGTPPLPADWGLDGPLPARVSEHLVHVVRTPEPGDTGRPATTADGRPPARRSSGRWALAGVLLCALTAVLLLVMWLS